MCLVYRDKAYTDVIREQYIRMSFDDTGQNEGDDVDAGNGGSGNGGDEGERDNGGLGSVEASSGGDVDEPDDVSRIRRDEKTRAMLKVLDEARDRDGDGRVGTSEFRERTGMSAQGVHYRYDKLEDAGFVEVEYDGGATPEGVAPMKVAVLTERGEEAVSRGLAGDTADVAEDTVEDRVDSLGDEIRENREALKDIYEWIQSTDEKLAELEGRVDELIEASQDVDVEERNMDEVGDVDEDDNEDGGDEGEFAWDE